MVDGTGVRVVKERDLSPLELRFSRVQTPSCANSTFLSHKASVELILRVSCVAQCLLQFFPMESFWCLLSAPALLYSTLHVSLPKTGRVAIDVETLTEP